MRFGCSRRTEDSDDDDGWTRTSASEGRTTRTDWTETDASVTTADVSSAASTASRPRRGRRRRRGDRRRRRSSQLTATTGGSADAPGAAGAAALDSSDEGYVDPADVDGGARASTDDAAARVQAAWRGQAGRVDARHRASQRVQEAVSAAERELAAQMIQSSVRRAAGERPQAHGGDEGVVQG